MDGGNTSGSGISPILHARRFARHKNITYNRIDDQKIEEEGYAPTAVRAIMRSDSKANIRFLNGGRDCENQNNDSLVVHVQYQEASFLFTGDAGAEGDEQCTGGIPHLLEWYADTGLLNIDVYKVGHHGSRQGTTVDLLKAMTPNISIISAGKNETRSPGSFHAWYFGHPRESTVSLLEDFTTLTRLPVAVYTMYSPKQTFEKRPIDKAVYCTCWDGDVVVSVDEMGRKFNVEVGQ
jgi:hypothetical protein